MNIENAVQAQVARFKKIAQLVDDPHLTNLFNLTAQAMETCSEKIDQLEALLLEAPKKRETQMTNTCPYCRAPVRIEPDDRSDFENEFREAQCGSCAKFFTYSTEVSFSYYPQKADCLNDDEHIFHKTTRLPGGFLKLTCKTCGEERSVSIQTIRGDS